MGRETLLPLPWPTGGFVENSSETEQPPLTTPGCLNVRVFDALDRRKRGGQRTGISRYITDAVNGSSPIQAIGSVTLAFDSTAVEVTQTFLDRDFDADIASDGDLDVVDPDLWELWTNNFTSRSESTVCAIEVGTSIAGGNRGCFVPDACANAWQEAVYAGTPITLGQKFVLTSTSQIPSSTSFGHPIQWRIDTASRNRLSIRVDVFSGDLRIRPFVLTAGSDVAGTIDSGSTIVSGLTNTDPHEFQIRASGNVFTCWVNGAQIWTWTVSTHSSNTDIGFGVYESTAGDTITQSYKIQKAQTPASLRTTKLVVVSGGSIFSGNRVEGLQSPGTSTSVQVATGLTDMSPAFQKMYFCDGLPSGYRVLDPKTNNVTAWQDAITDGALPVGGTGTRYNITAVDLTLKTFTVAEDVSAVFSAGDFLEVRDGTSVITNDVPVNNNQSFTVVSAVFGADTTVTVNETIPLNSVSGSIAVGDVACRNIALYRGGVFLYGLETDPQNWFLLQRGDPNNVQYFPTVINSLQAVAGNNGLAGKLGDVITAAAPINDDFMVLGAANSISVMKGDPAGGGQIDLVVPKIGISGPEAWTLDTENNMWFFWLNGLYKMDLEAFTPILVSQGRLDKTFRNLNLAQVRIMLEYDPDWQGVHVFVTDDDQQTTPLTHYFYDIRNDSFWPDQYPVAQGPTTVFRFNADNPEDNAVLLGGFDSVLRRFDETATDDDGTVVSSHCQFTPITGGDILAWSRVQDMVMIMDAASSATTFKIYVGNTVEKAKANTTAGKVRVKRTLRGGRNTSIRHKVSQNAIIMELSQAGLAGAGATWAYEKAVGRIAVGGRVHGKGV